MKRHCVLGFKSFKKWVKVTTQLKPRIVLFVFPSLFLARAYHLWNSERTLTMKPIQVGFFWVKQVPAGAGEAWGQLLRLPSQPLRNSKARKFWCQELNFPLASLLKSIFLILIIHNKFACIINHKTSRITVSTMWKANASLQISSSQQSWIHAFFLCQPEPAACSDKVAIFLKFYLPLLSSPGLPTVALSDLKSSPSIISHIHCTVKCCQIYSQNIFSWSLFVTLICSAGWVCKNVVRTHPFFALDHQLSACLTHSQILKHSVKTLPIYSAQSSSKPPVSLTLLHHFSAAH